MTIGIRIGPMDRILVVAPHQDDEAIGCGGSLLKWRAAGAAIGVIWVSATTAGERHGTEARAAAMLLGLTWTEAMGMPPVGLSFDVAVLDAMVRAIREFGPSVILLPHGAEDDRQHRVVAELGQEAEWIASYPMRLDLGPPVERARVVLGYEVWTPICRPVLHSDISAFAAGKENVIACYASQVEIANFPAAALGLNRYRGVMSGAGAFAEAFAVVRICERGGQL